MSAAVENRELRVESDSRRHVARLGRELLQQPQMELPLTHRFTPGLYIREIFMPKGALVVSRIHKTEHPFVVSQGHAAVWVPGEGVVQIKAPFCGITKPGTQRILFIHEDCIWTTFHITDETDPEKIVALVTETPVVEMADAEAFKAVQETVKAEGDLQ